MSELLEISSNILLVVCLLFLWFNVMIDLLGEMGTNLFLTIASLGIFFSFPLYLLEYIFTGDEFRYSTAGYMFMFFSAVYLLVIYGAFFFQRYMKNNSSLLDRLAKKYGWNS